MEGLRAKFDSAVQAGDLIFYPSQVKTLCCEGIPFEIRICPGLKKKISSDAAANYGRDKESAQFDPFLPYDQRLEVAHLERNLDHAILFNKFALVPSHLLVITKHFEEQSDPITKSSFDAMLETMEKFRDNAVDWLVFYNCGKVAGASQHHRHFQLMPFSPGTIPIEPNVPVQPGKGDIPAYHNFQHHFYRFPESNPGSVYERYTEALEKLPADCSSYNILFTSRWFLLVPRKQEEGQTGTMNALAFAGCMMMLDEEGFASWIERVKTPIHALELMTYPSLS